MANSQLATRNSEQTTSSLPPWFSLLLGDWLESWRGMFPKHDARRQWLFIGAFSLMAALLVGGMSRMTFAAMAEVLGPRMPHHAVWAGPFLATIAYGWFFLSTIWLGRTYRRRERVIPLLLSPLPAPALAAYMMLRDTGMLFLMLTLLSYPFLLGGLIGTGADVGVLVLSLPLWLLTLGAALAMANATILGLFKVLPAGWEGPMSFACANVLILMLPFMTRGLNNPEVPFYWPGLVAKQVLTAAPGPQQWLAAGALLGLFAAIAGLGAWMTGRLLHSNWSKSEELVPSKLMGKISFLKGGQGPLATVIFKDWLLTSRAWGEVLIVLILLGVAFRLRADTGLPVFTMTGAPLLGALLASWALVELLAFLGESHKEGPTTLLLSMSPLSPKQLVLAKLTAIAVPRLVLGELAFLIMAWKGDLALHHVLIGQVGLVLMIATLSWLEVPQAFSASESRLPGWLKLWDRFYDFWRLIAIYPLVGLLCVIGTQVAAIAWDQGVSGLTGMLLGAIALMTAFSAGFSRMVVKLKLGRFE